MESYKHSCPFCGQRIEYTLGYCGHQMKCPMCGQTVTFPAIPPKSGGPSLRVKGNQAKTERKWSGKVPRALGFLRDFQHWNVVWQCAVPFLIIAGLLAGALFVKNKLGAPFAATGDVPVVQADPDAWQKNIDSNRAGQAVQAAVKVLDQANALLDYEQKARHHLGNADALTIKGADERVERAQNMANAARKQFDAAETKYRELGGTIDYRSQLRKY